MILLQDLENPTAFQSLGAVLAFWASVFGFLWTLRWAVVNRNSGDPQRKLVAYVLFAVLAAIVYGCYEYGRPR